MVDDEKRFRETTRKILGKKGFDTHLAEDGTQALEKLILDPDVVILDIKMPGMDGHETLARIKEKKPDIPVIMLTGHGGAASAKQALVEGAYDYLSKPCDINLLADKIHEACSRPTGVKPNQEKKITEMMIPIEGYTVINGDQSLGEAIRQLRASFTVKLATDSIMETGHRSILIRDQDNRIQGVLAIRDMLRAIMPSYLQAPKPSLADTIEYSPIFWDGMFTTGIGQMKDTPIKDFMSPLPVSIEGEANAMEAAHLMLASNHRRLLVEIDGEIRGIVREQDLFFEMDRLLGD